MDLKEARSYLNYLLTLNIRGEESFGPMALAFIKDNDLGGIGLEPEEQFSLLMATVASLIRDERILQSVSDVKVVLAEDSSALYFSRAALPFSRDGEAHSAVDRGAVLGFKHFGLYVYSPQALSEVYADSRAAKLESVEKLEQLRLLGKGYKIGVHIVDSDALGQGVEVDTLEDLETAQKLIRD